jgi:hypothetical protein
MAFKSMDALKKAIGKKMKEALSKDVLEYTKEKIQEGIKVEVYEVYEPVEYKRTFRFLQEDNIVHVIHGDFDKYSSEMELSVFHHALTDDGRALTPLVILGQEQAKMYQSGLELYGNIALYNDDYVNRISWELARRRGNKKPFWASRNFIEYAKWSMEKDEIVKRIKKHLS